MEVIETKATSKLENDITKDGRSFNYLEYIPVPANGLKFETVDGKGTIFQENKGLFNFIAQKLWKKPRISQIHLDDMGNFVWPLMDGERDIMAIAALIKEEYGEKAEPLYERLAKYMKNLESYSFIIMNKPEEATEEVSEEEEVETESSEDATIEIQE